MVMELKRVIVVIAIGVATCSAYAQQANNIHGLGDKDGLFSPASGLQLPRLVRAMPAVYPADPGAQAVEGSCTLSLVIGANGTLAKYRIVHSLGAAFDAAAVKALNDSAFQPGKMNGSRAAVWIDVWVPFHADKTPSLPEILPLKHVDNPPILTSSVEAIDIGSGGKAKYQGVSQVSVLVTEDGLPASIHISRPLGMGLDQRALEAVNQYRFKPAMEDGKPVPMRVNLV